MRAENLAGLRRVLMGSLFFLLSVLTLNGGEFGFVEIPDGLVDEKLRAEIQALVDELSDENDVALGVTVLEDATREEALVLAAKVRSEEKFVDLVIHLVLSTAGPEQDGHLVRVNLPQQQDRKVLVQPFFNAFGRCRDKDLENRLRQLLAEVSDQVDIFVLQRSHEQEKFGSGESSEVQAAAVASTSAEDSPWSLWLVIAVVSINLLVFVLGIIFLMRSVAPQTLRFDSVTIHRRLQAPYAGGSPYLLRFKKKSRR